MDPHTPKVCVPFLTRARELASKDRVIAYWCKFMAAKVALDQLDSLDDNAKLALEDIMTDLEKTKAELSDNELVTDDEAGSAYIYNFASRVFDGADATDRNGKATRATAKEFLAASNFFELLSIFGPLETDVNEKITYSKWKASSIAKAFREGRTPTPGPANAPQPSPVVSHTVEDGISTGIEQAGEGTTPFDSHANDSTDDVSRQVRGHSSSSQAHPSSSGNQQSSIIDLSEDQDQHVTGGMTDVDDGGDDLEDRFKLPPAPNDNPGAPPRSLPSVPDESSNHHPSAPPEIPSFPPSAPSFPSFPTSSSSATHANGPSSSAYSSQPSQPPPSSQAASVQPSAPPAQSSSQSYSASGASNAAWQPEPTTIDPVVTASAQKHAKFAISALNYDDVETARKELRLALQLIGG